MSVPSRPSRSSRPVLRPQLGSLLACVLIGVGLLTGCLPDAAVTGTGASLSQPPEPGSEVDPDAFGDLVAASFEDVGTARMRLSADLMGSITGDGVVDYTGATADLDLVLTSTFLGGEGLRVLVVDEVTYLNLGSMTEGKFIRFDADEPDNPFAGGLGAGLDPQRALQRMSDAVESVTFVDTEQVEGQPLRHYRVTADASQMLAGQETPWTRDTPESVTYDVWFDEQNRFVQLSVDAGQEQATTVRIYDRGVSADIAAPDKSQIADKSLIPGWGQPSA